MNPTEMLPVDSATPAEVQPIRKTLAEVVAEVRLDCVVRPEQYVEEVVARGGGE